jgi:hypothetical protein
VEAVLAVPGEIGEEVDVVLRRGAGGNDGEEE